MDKKKKVIIVGGTGYGGLGLLEILLHHPGFEVTQIVARKESGMRISDVWPHLRGHCDLEVVALDAADLARADLAFFSTPDRVGMGIIRPFLERGIRVIDYSGDFRFQDPETYAAYATSRGISTQHLAEDLLPKCVFGLPELYAAEIRQASIVGNAGCNAMAIILGLLPVVSAGWLQPDDITSFGVTGVSGAGRMPGDANYYPARYDDANVYRVASHQHRVETEAVLNAARPISSAAVRIAFTPCIVPMCRGILITSCIRTSGMTQKDVRQLYEEYYASSPFVQITDDTPHTSWVKGTNNCVVQPLVDPRTGMLVVTSVLDNLQKGQSGNAVQCANLMFGFPPETAIPTLAQFP